MNFNQSQSSPQRAKSPYAKSNVQTSGYYQQSQVQDILTIKKNQLKAQESPSKSMFQDETGLWRSRCQELERSLQQTSTDLEIANYKNKKTKDLEEKVELVLKHNSQLLNEQDSIQKQVKSKYAEVEIWKSKYEQQMNQVISMRAKHQLEINNLNNEISRLRQILDQSHMTSIKEIEDNKSRVAVESHSQLQMMKQEHCEQIANYESQLEKYRDLIADREREMAILQAKLNEAKNLGDNEINRVKEDKEKLKMKMSQLEVENQKESSIVKNKIMMSHQENLDNIKRFYQNQLEVQQSEIRKLKDIIELKTQEISKMIQQSQNQKQNSEEESNVLREEIQELKLQLAENNKQNEEELNKLKDNLATIHSNDLNGLKFHHENQSDALNQEIDKLRILVQQKSGEIDQQIREKIQQRDNYNQEILRLNKDNEMWKNKLESLATEKKRELVGASTQLNQVQKSYIQFQEGQNKQILQQEHDLENLKLLLTAKQEEIDKNRQQSLATIELLENEIQKKQEAIQNWEQKYTQLNHEMEQQLEDLKLHYKILESKSSDQEKKNLTSIDLLEQDINRLKDTVSIKQDECKNQREQIEQQNIENSKQFQEITQLNERISLSERQKNIELEQLRKNLNNQYTYTINNMQKSFENQQNIQQSELKDIQIQLEIKDQELGEYIKKYEKLEFVLKDYLNNPNKQRDFGEVLTQKNLYDVLIKTKSKSPVKSPVKSPYKY